MKATLKIITLLALSSGLASAATSVISAYYDTSFQTAAGAFLGTGFTAKIGITSVGSFASTDDFAAVNATWTNVSLTNIAFKSSAGNFSGYFTGTFEYSTNPGAAICLWVTDGANQNFVATINQVFANDANAPLNSNTYDLTFANHGVQSIKLGSFVAGADGFGGTGGNFVLNNAAVPEPSAALLGVIGALGLLRRRRI